MTQIRGNYYEKDNNKSMQTKLDHLQKINAKYHCVVMLSGGMDSSKTLLYLIKNYKLNILALTIIHPLLNDLSINNTKNITKLFNIDHITVSVSKDFFMKMMKNGILNSRQFNFDAKFGCHICGSIYRMVGIKTAMNMNIPVVISGHDKAQMGKSIETEEETKTFFMESNYYLKVRKLYNSICSEYNNTIYDYNFEGYNIFPTVLKPLKIIDTEYKDLDNYELCSLKTNCSARPFFTYLAYKQYNIHPFEKEIFRAIKQNKQTILEKVCCRRISKYDHQKVLKFFKDLYTTELYKDINYLKTKYQHIKIITGEEYYHYVLTSLKYIYDYSKFFNIRLDQK